MLTVSCSHSSSSLLEEEEESGYGFESDELESASVLLSPVPVSGLTLPSAPSPVGGPVLPEVPGGLSSLKNASTGRSKPSKGQKHIQKDYLP